MGDLFGTAPKRAPRLDDAHRLAWLRLIRTDGVGPRTFRSLVNRFGGAQAALDALPDLSRRAGRPVTPATLEAAQRELEAAARRGVRFVALGEPEFPAALAQIADAPPLLAVAGEVAALSRPVVAIVGSRNASAAGLLFTERLAADLGAAGFVVASGLARGIDTRAHLATVGTGTAAVLAGGHARVYPSENKGLLERIVAAGGAALSEMPIEWEPRGRDFPRRNRIVSGLAAGVVVVEAARRSGSLITARFALEQGREVFAVPGSPLDPRAEGPNDLIRDGATLVRGAADVIEALAPMLGSRADARNAGAEGFRQSVGEPPFWDELDLDGEPGHVAPAQPAAAALDEGAASNEAADRPEAALLDLLGATPVALDDLVRASGRSAREVSAALVDLELSGRAVRSAGAWALRPAG